MGTLGYPAILTNIYEPSKNQSMSETPTTSTISPEKETKIIQLLLKCGLFLQRELNQVFREFGLNQQQFSVLAEIVHHGPISQKKLGEWLFYEKSNISKIVKILRKRDLISIMPAPFDRRSTLLVETPDGLALWKACMDGFNRASSEFMSFLSKEDVTKTIELLMRLQMALDPNNDDACV